jgi:hypothetical protein
VAAYGEGSEAQAIREEIGDFDFGSSIALHEMFRLFGPHLRLMELKGIVLAVREFIKLKYAIELPRLTRNAKRSYPLLIKYIEANYNQMMPIMSTVSLCDKNKVDLGIGATRRHVPPEIPAEERPLNS